MEYNLSTYHDDQMVSIMVGKQNDEGIYIFTVREIEKILAMHKSLTKNRDWAPAGASIICSMKTKIPVKYVRIIIAEYLVHDKVEMSTTIDGDPFKIVADVAQDQFPGYRCSGIFLTQLFFKLGTRTRFWGPRNGWQCGRQIDAAVERLCEQDYYRYMNQFGYVSLILFTKIEFK